MLKILKNKKAEGYIDIAVAVLVIAFVLVFVMSIWSMMTIKQDMIYMCEELLADDIAIGGEIDADLKKEVAIADKNVAIAVKKA